MPTINKYRITVAILSVAVLLLLITLIAQQQTASPAPTQNATSTAAAANASSSSSTAAKAVRTTTGSEGAKTVSAGSGSAGTVTGFTIRLLTPIPDQTWTIAGQNLISWDRPAIVTGHIDLLDAKTKALVGVILNQTGPRQTSYTWTARFMSISRNSPTLTSVVPGTYLVRVVFDGNNLAPITSGPITIVE